MERKEMERKEMSVLVEGMKMPVGCEWCPLAFYKMPDPTPLDHEELTVTWRVACYPSGKLVRDEIDEETKRATFCPLKEVSE